jgi:hypothetical protein
MADIAKPLQIRRVKAKKIRIFRGFDDKRIRQRNYGIYFYFNPAAFRIAWHVPVGTPLHHGKLHESGVDDQPWRNSEQSLSVLSVEIPPVRATGPVRQISPVTTIAREQKQLPAVRKIDIL